MYFEDFDMADAQERNGDDVFSKPVRAGKRTYFFDVKATKNNDYYLTITESKRRLDRDGRFVYDKHKIFLYKEDFNKFIKALGETMDYVKTDLMPDFDFDAFNHEYPEGEGGEYVSEVATKVAAPVVEIAEPTIEVAAPAPAETEVNNSDANNLSSEEVDKW